jgi:hypothetical protein
MDMQPDYEMQAGQTSDGSDYQMSQDNGQPLLAQMMRMLREIKAQQGEMQSQQNKQASTIVELRTKLVDQGTQGQGQPPPALATTTPVTPASTAPSVEISRPYEPPRPSKLLSELYVFNGVRTDFRPWLQQAHAKLKVDYANQPPMVRFWFIHGRLGETARRQVSPWVAANAGVPDDQFTDDLLQGLIKQLEVAYDDPEQQKRALRKLQSMEQGSRRFVHHLAEFEQRMIEAGGNLWEDVLKISWLDKTLNNDLARYLVAAKIPESYEDFKSLLHQVSQRAEALKNSSKPVVFVPPQRRTNPRESTDTMDWEPSPRARVVPTHASGSRKRAKWVSDDVIQSRRNNNQCFRCGSDKHRAQRCDLLPAERPLQTVAVRPDHGREQDESDDEESLSGKD